MALDLESEPLQMLNLKPEPRGTYSLFFFCLEMGKESSFSAFSISHFILRGLL